MGNSSHANSLKIATLAILAIAATGLAALLGQNPANAQGKLHPASEAAGEFKVAQFFQPG